MRIVARRSALVAIIPALVACAPSSSALDTAGAGAADRELSQAEADGWLEPEGLSKQGRVSAERACSSPGDCVVVPRTCCGECGAATDRDSTAVSAAYLQANGYTCVGDHGCPDCFAETEATLAATCRAGSCRVVRLMRSPITRCDTDADCVLHHEGCCACGARRFVAIRGDSVDAYMRLVCASPTQACPECVGPPVPPQGAACVEHRCAARAS